MTPATQTPAERGRPVGGNVIAHRPQLDDFLFAAIGEESNGQCLTVVSALARLGLDPWIEADRFSSMPKAAAVQLLAAMLDRLLPGPWSTDAVAIARRLVKLLPAPSASIAPGVRKPVPIASWLIAGLLAVMLLLAAAAGRELASGLIFSSPPASFSVDDPQPTER